MSEVRHDLIQYYYPDGKLMRSNNNYVSVVILQTTQKAPT